MGTPASCTTFCRGGVRSGAGDDTPTRCKRIDRAALWLRSGLAAAFFASLERCSCVAVATNDDDDSAAKGASEICRSGRQTRQDFQKAAKGSLPTP
ncbi:hypothetical protein EJ110_NYTH04595 [Nymphaea thermarum]|nr:hypothetical protein EJ110_NYTH04595 [Nymphaea thermarum]